MDHEHVENPEVVPPLGEGYGIEVLDWKDLLEAVPNSAKLLMRVIADPRAPVLPKILAGAAVLYTALPIDVIPDALPLIGQIDDVVVLFVAVDWLLTNTDEAVLLEHWDGDPRTLRAIRNTMEQFGSGVVRKFARLRRSRREFRSREGAGSHG
ncbi:MAG: hypothetical protein DCC49_00910 [Acidobacteria bacterium]|nr:MAG: hypothetical protein DCC49_00910 [Acidobacteriota bacterium]